MSTAPVARTAAARLVAEARRARHSVTAYALLIAGVAAAGAHLVDVWAPLL